MNFRNVTFSLVLSWPVLHKVTAVSSFCMRRVHVAQFRRRRCWKQHKSICIKKIPPPTLTDPSCFPPSYQITGLKVFVFTTAIWQFEIPKKTKNWELVSPPPTPPPHKTDTLPPVVTVALSLFNIRSGKRS